MSEHGVIVPTRRRFLAGLGLLVAALAVIRVARLMPVRAIPRFVTIDTSVWAEDQIITQLDVLYGYTFCAPDWMDTTILAQNKALNITIAEFAKEHKIALV